MNRGDCNTVIPDCYPVGEKKTFIAERSEANDCGSHSRLCMMSATDRPRACVADWSCARVRHPARAYLIYI